MPTLNDFIVMMTDFMGLLPRYIDLNEKIYRSIEEEAELDVILHKMEACKREIIKLIPQLNNIIFEDIVNDLNIPEYKMSKMNAKSLGSRELRETMRESLREWLNNSVN
jgi:hypothetical protein